jgi:VIT1/CCC1 family predicted Fe2+/Mn2+ transporter
MKLHPFVDLTTISLILSILALSIVILVLRYKRQLRELEQETSIILKALDNGLSLNEAMTEKRNRDWQRTWLASRVYSAIGAVIILAAGLSAMIYLKETPILEVCLWFFFLGAVLLTVGIVTGVSCRKKKTDQ